PDRSTMSTWSSDQLRRVGDAIELQLAPRRSDGTPRSFTTMWVVRVRDDLYVRSAGGPARPWYRHARANDNGRIRAGGVERDVTFGEAAPDVQAAIDAAYHAKYDATGPSRSATSPDPTRTPSPSVSSGANHERSRRRDRIRVHRPGHRSAG